MANSDLEIRELKRRIETLEFIIITMLGGYFGILISFLMRL